MRLLDDGNIYIPDENGNFISENQRRIGQILSEYDPNLQLQWIPPVNRGPDDYPFRVVDFSPGRPPYVVCFAHECDERLLAKVFQSDGTKNNVLNYLDAHNAAVEAVRLKKMKEQRMEDHEFAMSVLRHKKINYIHNGFNWGKVGGK